MESVINLQKNTTTVELDVIYQEQVPVPEGAEELLNRAFDILFNEVTRNEIIDCNLQQLYTPNE